jgi:hypothetical protein
VIAKEPNRRSNILGACIQLLQTRDLFPPQRPDKRCTILLCFRIVMLRSGTKHPKFRLCHRRESDPFTVLPSQQLDGRRWCVNANFGSRNERISEVSLRQLQSVERRPQALLARRPADPTRPAAIKSRLKIGAHKSARKKNTYVFHGVTPAT